MNLLVSPANFQNRLCYLVCLDFLDFFRSTNTTHPSSLHALGFIHNMILDDMPLHPLWKVSTKALNWLEIIKVFNINNDDKQKEVLYNALVFLSLYPSFL